MSTPRRLSARAEVRHLRELRELALGGLAAVALLEPRGAGTQVRGDGLAARPVTTGVTAIVSRSVSR
jgi:hypothetical protein